MHYLPQHMISTLQAAAAAAAAVAAVAIPPSETDLDAVSVFVQ